MVCYFSLATMITLLQRVVTVVVCLYLNNKRRTGILKIHMHRAYSSY